MALRLMGRRGVMLMDFCALGCTVSTSTLCGILANQRRRPIQVPLRSRAFRQLHLFKPGQADSYTSFLGSWYSLLRRISFID